MRQQSGLALLVVLLVSQAVAAQTEPPGAVAPAVAGDNATTPSELPTIAERTRGLERRDGFIPLFPDAKTGTILAAIPDDGESFLYATGLSSGLGSNPVGLDRGQWGRTRVVQFRRVGPRVYLMESNLRFRALDASAAERRAVRESFADSVLWSTDVLAESEGRLLIDLQTLLVRDAHDVVTTLKDSGQGDFRFRDALSFVDVDGCRVFPRNTELNAVVTFSSDRPGRLVSATAADGASFSLRMHHSLVALPEPGYRPRIADPRVAAITIAFADYAAPLDRPVEQRWITRHRLQKANPDAERSAPVEPIVYYIDPGTPQPVRDALLEGARWWNAAFEAAGFIDAFQVRMLPEDVDPLDVRYNVIQWVHRRTRGWSYGQSIIDPRTGEIIKGHVLLGSLRVRQDRMIVDGLTAAATGSSGRSGVPGGRCGIAGPESATVLALLDPQLSPVEVSLARLRQLSAHEVGHTIGFAHNFAASTWGDRASVMDYPAPRVRITADQTLDLSDAYGVGIGPWDTFMVRYAYTEFADAASEAAGLRDLIDEARDDGMRYLSDADARPAGAASPAASLWDNGTDPVQELRHLLQVRELALRRFDDGDILPGQPLAELSVAFVPVYLMHRYQVEATAKAIGGFDYEYAVAGEPAPPLRAFSVAVQRRALDALLETVQPEQLEIAPGILERLLPPPWPSASDRERLESRTAMIFDPDSAVQTAAELTLGSILQAERVARLDARGDETWNLTTVLDTMQARILTVPDDPRAARIQRIVRSAFVRQVMALAGDQSTTDAVRAAASSQLRNISLWLSEPTGGDRDRGHALMLRDEVDRFLNRPHAESVRPASPDVPPGSPIGGRP